MYNFNSSGSDEAIGVMFTPTPGFSKTRLGESIRVLGSSYTEFLCVL